MNPIKFPEHNDVIAEDQPQYEPLPVLRFEDGRQISCWRLSLWERIKILFTGNLWCEVLTFKQPLQPLYFTVEKAELLKYQAPKWASWLKWLELSFEDWNNSSDPKFLKHRVYIKGVWTPIVWCEFRYKSDKF